MISKNFKTLKCVDSEEYIFNSYVLRNSIREFKKRSASKAKTSEILFDIAEICNVSIDAINNWMYGKNGPADYELVCLMAEYLSIDPESLLRRKKGDSMGEAIIQDKKIQDASDCKNSIRSIYHKMSNFMEIVVATNCFDCPEEEFYRYEETYLDIKRTLAYYLLDIPEKVYVALKNIVEVEFAEYLYGPVQGMRLDIFEVSEYEDWCTANNKLLDDDDARHTYLEEKAEAYYSEMREILRDYIPK